MVYAQLAEAGFDILTEFGGQKEGVEMKKRQHDYKIIPFPRLRREVSIAIGLAQQKHMIHVLAEVDVTRPRQYLREHKAKTGESLSFTAFIVACLAHAVDENTSLHAYRKGGKRLVLFDEVDVATQVEREVAGHKQPITSVIRAANTKTFREIHDEIRAAQVEEVEKAWAGFKEMQWVVFVPPFLSRFFWWCSWWLLGRYPQMQKHYGGTVGISAVGMFGKGAGWGIPITAHTLDITLGGIAEKPGVVDWRIEVREDLN